MYMCDMGIKNTKPAKCNATNLQSILQSELHLKAKHLTRLMYTPLDEAVSIARERKNDLELIKKVEENLASDIPDHFLQIPLRHELPPPP